MHDATKRAWGRACAAGGAIALLAVACRAPSGASITVEALAAVVDTASGERGGRAATGGGPVAEVDVDVDEGDFPRRVVFDASDSVVGGGDVVYEWSFGDGTLTHDGPTTVHTYVGAGEFVATLTVLDGSGRSAPAEVTIDLDTPDCPEDLPPLTLGGIEDDGLDEISGMAASRIAPGAFWVHEDADADEIAAIDLYGNTLSEHDLPGALTDVEDVAAVVDPTTGVPMLFLADIGDNDAERAEVALWIAEEPDPLDDGDLDPIEVRLTYPSGAVDAETLLVDPFTLDAYVITKADGDDTEVFVKRAPHEEGGPFVLESLGQYDDLDFMATGGDVSADGLAVVVRGYGDTAYLWVRDGYLPLEEVFDEEPCAIDLHEENQGEAVTFTIDGRGLVTTSEGEGEAVWFVGF